MWLKIWLLIAFQTVQIFGVQIKFGVLRVFDTDNFHQDFCIKYYPELYNLTKDANEAKHYKLKDVENLMQIETCQDSSDLDVVNGKVGYVSTKNTTGNCSIAARALFLEEHGSSGLLADSSVSAKFNVTETGRTQEFVATFYDSLSGSKLWAILKERPEANFYLYGPEEPEKEFDASIMVIFAMALFTVSVGSLWSGYSKQQLRQAQLVQSLPSHGVNRGQHPGQTRSPSLSSGKEEDVSEKITPVWVLGFVCCMCLMLVLLYFFFSALVYIIIAMFVLASIIATYACFEPLVMWSYKAFPWCPTIQFPKCNLFLCIIHMELRQFLLLMFSISLAIVWVVFRNEYWAWILQDILGILFSINMLRVLRLPSFMICTILLSILFFYDIFFVFITPLLTKDGKSIMVEVATGGQTGEQLPMVLKVPHLKPDPLRICWTFYSMLGFGDILVPGLLLSYCHSYDLLKATPFKIYWSSSIFCYALSLLICFAALFLMDYAQPALLYIVPCTLIPISIIALIRGEFKEFWDGEKSVNGVLSNQEAERRNSASNDEEEGGNVEGGDNEEEIPRSVNQESSQSPDDPVTNGEENFGSISDLNKGRNKKEDSQKLIH